jgi:hypothetical protein
MRSDPSFVVQFLDRTRCILRRAHQEWIFDTTSAALEAARNQPESEGAKVDIFDEYGRRMMVVWF